MMNDRITELMIEAGKTIPGDKHIDADFCNKFAELIVRECITEVWIQLFNHGIDLSENILFLEAMRKTKEHFGITE